MPPRKQADPIDVLATQVAADHTANKNSPDKPTVDEAADTVAAGAIEGSGAVAAAGGDADQAAAGAIGGAAAAQAEVVDAVSTADEVPADEDLDPADVAFQRRLDRLVRIVEDSEFDSGTALGDLRDTVLDIINSMDAKTLPHMLDANQRRALGQRIEKACQLALRRVVQIIAEEDSLNITGTLLSKWSANGDAIEGKLKLDGIDDDVLLDFRKLAGHRVVVISADDKRFASERRPAPQGEGQDDLPFEGPARAPTLISSEPPAAPPADDSDLAGDETPNGAEGDSGAPVPAREGEGDDQFGVFDEGSGIWLINAEGGPDCWTEHVGEAGIWPHAKATEIAERQTEEDGSPAVVRRIAGD